MKADKQHRAIKDEKKIKRMKKKREEDIIKNASKKMMICQL